MILNSPISRLCLVSSVIIIADQLTKHLVQTRLKLHESVEVIQNLFSLTYILNPGGAFGFFAGQSLMVRKFVFIFLSAIIAGIVLFMFFRTAREHCFLSYAFALIFSGAAGNLIDRIRFGQVVDFLDFYLGAFDGPWHWPAFNIADSAISIGMAILIYHILFNKLPDL